MLILRPEAEADLQAAYDWYQAKREGLGDEFLLVFDSAIKAIEAMPKSYPVIHNRIRRVLLRRFPFGVFFVVTDHNIVVLAVMHARRDRGTWRGRG